MGSEMCIRDSDGALYFSGELCSAVQYYFSRSRIPGKPTELENVDHEVRPLGRDFGYLEPASRWIDHGETPQMNVVLLLRISEGVGTNEVTT